tara:strand:+ start:530 stop:727 length:198 start_codon:yes stop_codon:yes gene_type:complete
MRGIKFYNIRMNKENLSINKSSSINSGVGKKFLIISISMTILLNGSVALWFFWYVKKYGIDKFIS